MALLADVPLLVPFCLQCCASMVQSCNNAWGVACRDAVPDVALAGRQHAMHIFFATPSLQVHLGPGELAYAAAMVIFLV